MSFNLRAGCVLLAVASSAVTAEDAPLPRESVVEEIVVTANRREQGIQDIVGGIAVLQGEDLERAGAVGFEDYVFKIPGGDFVDFGAGVRKVALRGISNTVILTGSGAGGTTSPIGIYLDDTPIQGNGVLPDLDLYDLQRIEVLKGPQGTLYGEGAQGGAFKMLLNTADPSGFYTRAEFGGGQTFNGSGPNNAQKMVMNAPLTDRWASRLVATRRVDQGFVDFPNRGGEGENDATNLMARLHLDGQLSDALSASTVLLNQRQRLNQFAQVQLAEGDLANRYQEPNFADTQFWLAALTLDYAFDFATLTSSTSGFTNLRRALQRSPIVGAATFAVTSPITGAGVENQPSPAEQEWAESTNEQFGITQELRLVSSGDSRFDWVVGAFFRMRENDYHSFATNQESNQPPPVGPGLLDARGTESFEQIALFGEATVSLPANLELGLGLRGFHEEVGLVASVRYGGAFYALGAPAGPDATYPPQRFDIGTSAVTPKLSLSWLVADAHMVYAQVAQGVRSGGTNPSAAFTTFPPLFKPDSLWAYEIGAKTEWLGGRLTANLAAFHNDWQDLQVVTTMPAQLRGPAPVTLETGGVLNAGRAYSGGVEFDFAGLLFADLMVSLSVFIGEGEVTKGDEAGNIPDNTPLPQLAQLSYSAAINYTASRWSTFGFTPSFQLDTQATGDRSGAFVSGGREYPLEGFQTFNARIAFVGEQREFSFGVQNLSDERTQLGRSETEPETLTVGRPRTWSARVAFSL